MPNYWLMKSEPETFSIDQLKKDKTTRWEGVRNYQARNLMMNEMKIGDQVLFYHSNANPPGAIGIAEVSKPAAPDPTALDKKSEYFDPKASQGNPRWYCVEVKYVQKFKRLVSLAELKADKKLKNMMVTKKGQRLSIQPVSKAEFDHVLFLGGL